MKMIVFGASGRTGQAFVQQALHSGHHITAFVRNPSKLPFSDNYLTIIKGDATNKTDVASAIQGHDAVVSCLGANGLGKTSILSDMAMNIIDGMKTHEVERIVYVASAGIYKEIPGLSGFLAMKILRNVLADHRRAVDYIATADLDWTVARPMRLDEGELTKKYRMSIDNVPKNGNVISRDDVAHFILESIEKQNYIKQSVGLAY